MRLDADAHVARASIPVTSWGNRFVAVVANLLALGVLGAFFAFIQMAPATVIGDPERVDPSEERISTLRSAMDQAELEAREAESEVHHLEGGAAGEESFGELGVRDLRKNLARARELLGDYSQADLSKAKRCVASSEELGLDICTPCTQAQSSGPMDQAGCMSSVKAAALLERAGVEVDMERFEANAFEGYIRRLRGRRGDLADIEQRLEAAIAEAAARQDAAIVSRSVYVGAVDERQDKLQAAQRVTEAKTLAAGRVSQGRIVGLVCCVFLIGVLVKAGSILWNKPRLVPLEIHAHGVKFGDHWIGAVTGARADHSTVIIERAGEPVFILHSWMDPVVATRLAQLINQMAMSAGDADAELVAKAEIEALDQTLRAAMDD